MGDHVAEMSRLNTMIDNSTSRAQRDRLRVELVEHGEAVIDLWEEYRKVRHPGAQLRSLPGGAELRATDLADLDLV
jgi:intracellular sulfur oxidation DsrE/DsrF family protein